MDIIKKEELSKKYAELSTKELLKILDERHDYTDVAVSVAIEELSKRNVSETEINDIKKAEMDEAMEFVKKNIVDGLNLLQKNFFYFLWIPIFTYAFRRNFEEDAFRLKLKQASYYSWFGFIFLMLAGIISVLLGINDLQTLAIWIVGFLVAYFFDEKMNRRRLEERLIKSINPDNEENP